jgi:hypothetical protein
MDKISFRFLNRIEYLLPAEACPPFFRNGGRYFVQASEDMMKIMTQLAAAVVLLILTGCSASKVAYSNKATLSPGIEEGTYHVAFVVEDLTGPEGSRVVGAPVLSVLAGQEGKISIGDGVNSVFCTAVVDDTSGRPEAKISVSVMKNGNVVWSENETVVMTR